MQLELIRTYYPNGTNGVLMLDGRPNCHTIELPWQDNQPDISCIPEGVYKLEKRHSEHLGWHIWVRDVPGRDLILIHPANDAQKELKGCIAPVMAVSGAGQGLRSRDAFARLTARLFPWLDNGGELTLQIRRA